MSSWPHLFNTRWFNQSFTTYLEATDNLELNITDVSEAQIIGTDQCTLEVIETSHLEIITSDDLDSVIEDIAAVYETLYYEDHQNLVYNTTYYYQVQTSDGENLSDWSNEISLWYGFRTFQDDDDTVTLSVEEAAPVIEFSTIPQDSIAVDIEDQLTQREIQALDTISLDITEAATEDRDLIAADTLSLDVEEAYIFSYRTIISADIASIGLIEHRVLDAAGSFISDDIINIDVTDVTTHRDIHTVDTLVSSLEDITQLTAYTSDNDLLILGISTTYGLRLYPGILTDTTHLILTEATTLSVSSNTTDIVSVIITDTVYELDITDIAEAITLGHSTLGLSVLSLDVLSLSTL